MSKQSEILNETLEAVNKNNMITVSFSNRERIIIKNMMEQYAKQCAKASLNEASNKIPYDGTDKKMVLDSIITNPENIILL